MDEGTSQAMTMASRIGHASVEPSYARLLAHARRGDRQAFESLLRLHDAELRGFLRRKVAAEEADDVLQDTWLAAWTSIASYTGKCQFKTWLYSIALFKVRDLYRRQARLGVSQPMTDRPDESTPFDVEDRRQWVLTALDELTADQRQLLELYYYAEMNLGEISRLLKRSLSAVKYQFYRAHKDIAVHLADGDDPPLASGAGGAK